MTNTELKNLIDSNVTNKNTASSITPANVGSSMKAVVDYVDQEVAATIITKTIKVTVSEADIATLHSTGKVLINNLDSAIKIIPINYYFKKQAGTIYASDFNTFSILDNNNNLYGTFTHPLLTNIGGHLVYTPEINFHSNMLDNNTQLRLTSASAFTGGTNGFDVYVTYIEIVL